VDWPLSISRRRRGWLAIGGDRRKGKRRAVKKGKLRKKKGADRRSHRAVREGESG